VYFFRDAVGEAVIGNDVLSRRANEYQGWVEAFARNHKTPIEWAERGVEQGNTFRSTVPKFPSADPNYRIPGRQRSRFTHYYFYIRDEALGPRVTGRCRETGAWYALSRSTQWTGNEGFHGVGAPCATEARARCLDTRRPLASFASSRLTLGPYRKTDPLPSIG